MPKLNQKINFINADVAIAITCALIFALMCFLVYHMPAIFTFVGANPSPVLFVFSEWVRNLAGAATIFQCYLAAVKIMKLNSNSVSNRTIEKL